MNIGSGPLPTKVGSNIIASSGKIGTISANTLTAIRGLVQADTLHNLPPSEGWALPRPLFIFFNFNFKKGLKTPYKA